MLTDEELKEARKRAEQAVADMPGGELRTTAFSVILTQLLSGNGSEPKTKTVASDHAPKARRAASGPKKVAALGSDSLGSRLLALREDGFFAPQRSLAEVREELKKHGWHYPLTSLSGPMQGLVRNRELRREQESEGDGKKKVWKYSNR